MSNHCPELDNWMLIC